VWTLAIDPDGDRLVSASRQRYAKSRLLINLRTRSRRNAHTPAIPHHWLFGGIWLRKILGHERFKPVWSWRCRRCGTGYEWKPEREMRAEVKVTVKTKRIMTVNGGLYIWGLPYGRQWHRELSERQKCPTPTLPAHLADNLPC